VRLLGYEQPLPWLARGEDGFVVEFPEEPPCEHAFALKVIVE
jgi:hypothetical protein